MPRKKAVRKDVKILHKLYDVKKKKDVIYPIPDLLTELLCTINMFEGTDEAHIEPIVKHLRDGHLLLKNVIGNHPEYQDNDSLKKLDAAYKAAGWDDNGLRWTSEDDFMGEDIFIVEFTSLDHTRWRLA